MARQAKASHVHVGEQFGKITVIGEPEFVQTGVSKKRRWRCEVKCECGRQYLTLVQNLLRASSCGCDTTPQKEGCTKHGMATTPLYGRWKGMIARCADSKRKHWDRYGGRGISVCDEWMDFETFAAWAAKHDLVDGMDIDRIDNDGNYCPENCRVVTHRVNQHNKSTSRMETIDGETKCLAEWALDSRCSVPYQTIQARLRYGWAIKDAVMKPALWFRERGIRRPRSKVS
jgi:hypothetical protein